MVDFTITRGDDELLTAQITEEGLPASLVDATVTFTAKRHPDYAAALISKSSEPEGGILITDAAGGVIEIDIARTDTQGLPAPVDLYYDIAVLIGGHSSTPLSGLVHVLADVSR